MVNDKEWQLTTRQREELDRRLDEMQADGGAGIPWEQVLTSIRAKHGQRRPSRESE